jgi:hypothetical protein
MMLLAVLSTPLYSVHGQPQPEADAQPSATEAAAPAAESLGSVIDRLLEKPSADFPIRPTPETLLVRRLYFDLIGLPATLDELDAYQQDKSEDRYARLVDQLIARPEFAEHWAERFDVMLMERRPNTHVPQEEWMNWLRKQIVTDVPLNHWMADLISADGAPGDNRPAARFLLDRAVDPHLITRDLGRLYFGRDLQCAQCHDHPSIDSYLQTDYHGMLGFVSSLSMVEITEGETKLQMIAEKAMNTAAFESVFVRGKFRRVFPHVPGGDEMCQTVDLPGEQYLDPTKPGYPAVPRQSGRRELATLIRNGAQEEFNRNLANRLWCMIFGSGIVHPVDLMHGENPPAQKDLLDALAAGLKTEGFRLRPFITQLVTTESYRRGSAPITYQSFVDADQSLLSANRADWLPQVVADVAPQIAELESQRQVVNEQVDAANAKYDQALAALEPIETQRIAALAAIDAASAAYTQSIDAATKLEAEQAAATEAARVAADKLSKLEAARDAVSTASLAIGEDAEVAAAATLLAARTTTLAEQLAGLRQAETAKQTEYAAAAQKRDGDRQSVVEAKANFAAVDQNHAPARAAVLAARQSMEDLKLYRTYLGSQQRALADYVEINQIYDSLEMATQSLTDQRELLRQAENQRDALSMTQSTLENRIAELNQTLESGRERAEQIASGFNQLDSQIADLQLAQTQLRNVAELVATTEPIDKAIDAIEVTLVSTKSNRNDIAENLDNEQQRIATAAAEIDAAKTELTALMQQIASQATEIAQLTSACDAAEKEVADRAKIRDAALSSLEEDLGRRFLAAQLDPLSPEQLGWSTLAVTGVLESYVSKHRAELEKNSPATAEQMADANWQAAREAEAIRLARKELQGNVDVFVRLYGGGPGQPQDVFFATADQALFTSNGGSLFAWSAASGNNVTQRVIAAEDDQQAAALLFRGILGRDPVEDEVAAVTQMFATDPSQRARLAQEMVWGLIASAEFRFTR